MLALCREELIRQVSGGHGNSPRGRLGASSDEQKKGMKEEDGKEKAAKIGKTSYGHVPMGTLTSLITTEFKAELYFQHKI